MSGLRKVLALGIVAVVVAAACGGSSGPSGPLTKVRLQPQWVAQSQFAGFFAAVNKGYYKDLGLDVEIKLGGPDIVPQQVVASDGAEFGIAWVPKMLASREAGAALVYTRHSPAAGRRGRRPRIRHRVGAEDARIARGWSRSRGHRAVLPALRDPRGGVQGEEHHEAGGLEEQEGRHVGLRERARAVRGDAQGRDRSDEGERRHDREAALRHVAVDQRRGRCRASDDLQRVRPGARAEEPED